MYSKKDQWIIFSVVNTALLLFAFGLTIYLKNVDTSPESKCAAIVLFKTYCPGCGGTRAFNALLQLDIINSFKYNPIVPLSVFSLIVYEIGMIKHLIKGAPRDSLIKAWMVFTFIGIWFAYSVIRIILLHYGIDILGDIII